MSIPGKSPAAIANMRFALGYPLLPGATQCEDLMDPPYVLKAQEASKEDAMYVENEKLLYVDCDDSLIMWNISEYPNEKALWIECYSEPASVVVNKKNINQVTKFYLLGYGIIVWSTTGAKWAKAVGNAVGIDKMVTAYLTKPRYHLDDKPCEEWMGPNVYRSPE